MSEIETREKILDAARVLFADLGYEGTSVREIAKKAEVNVASVNYYFNSKENLFLEVMKSSYIECANELKSIMEKCGGNIEEGLVEAFRYFIANAHSLKTHFKIKLSSQHSHHQVAEGTEDSAYGPPGGSVLALALKKMSPQASEKDIHWALRTLFSHIIQTSLIHSSCIQNNQHLAFCSQGDLEDGIRRLVRIVVQDIVQRSK